MVAYGPMMLRASEDLAVTGVGCVSGLGIGAVEFERALFAGETALRRVTTFELGAALARTAGHLDGFDPAAFLSPAKRRRIDRVVNWRSRRAAWRSITRSGAPFPTAMILASRWDHRRPAFTVSSTILIG